MHYLTQFNRRFSLLSKGEENAFLCNTIALSLIVAAGPFIAIFYACQLYTLIFGTIFIIMLISISFILNKYRRYFLAELNIMVQMGIVTFPFFTLLLDHRSGVYFIYIPVAILPHLLMNHRPPIVKWGISIAISLSGIALLITFTFFIPPPFYLHVSAFYSNILFTYALFTSLFMVTSLVAIFISAINQSNQKLNIAYEKLKKVKAEVQQLEELDGYNKVVQNIAHEFKNPLTFIRGTLELEIQDGRHDAYTTDIFTSLLDTFDRINYLIPKLLGYDFAQDPGGQYLVFDPNPVLTKLFKMTAATCKHHNIKQTLIPQSTHAIYGIRQAVIQIIINLFTNAIDALQLVPNNRSITVTTTDDTLPSDMQHPRNAVKFTVQDSGPGIPEHLIEHFMLPYSSSKRNNRKNVGLGLAIVARIIKEHDGHISFEPTHPTGATVHFWIPTPTPDQVTLAKSLEEPPLFFLDDAWFKQPAP